jgi:hypothetical protein
MKITEVVCQFGRDGNQTREIAKKWRDYGYRAIKFGWEPMGPSQAVDLDLARNGFTEADYLRQRVQEISARPCNHCDTSPVTCSASLHWLATCRDAFVFEDGVDDSPLRHNLTHRKGSGRRGLDHSPGGSGSGCHAR